MRTAITKLGCIFHRVHKSNSVVALYKALLCLTLLHATVKKMVSDSKRVLSKHIIKYDLMTADKLLEE